MVDFLELKREYQLAVRLETGELLAKAEHLDLEDCGETIYPILAREMPETFTYFMQQALVDAGEDAWDSLWSKHREAIEGAPSPSNVTHLVQSAAGHEAILAGFAEHLCMQKLIMDDRNQSKESISSPRAQLSLEQRAFGMALQEFKDLASDTVNRAKSQIAQRKTQPSWRARNPKHPYGAPDDGSPSKH